MNVFGGPKFVVRVRDTLEILRLSRFFPSTFTEQMNLCPRIRNIFFRTHKSTIAAPGAMRMTLFRARMKKHIGVIRTCVTRQLSLIELCKEETNKCKNYRKSEFWHS